MTKYLKFLQEQDNYALIIIGSAFFLVAAIFPNLETIYDLTEKLTTRKLSRLQHYIESKNLSEKTKDVLRDQIDSIAFRYSTGILTEKYLREEIIRLHEKANGKLTYLDFKRASQFLSIGKSGRLRVRKINKVDWAALFFNRFLFILISFSGLLVLLISVFGTLNFFQETVLFIYSIFLFIFSLVPLFQTYSVDAAKKIGKEINNDYNQIKEQLSPSITSESKQLRPFGLCKGEFRVPDDFDDPLPEEILKLFEGE